MVENILLTSQHAKLRWLGLEFLEKCERHAYQLSLKLE